MYSHRGLNDFIDTHVQVVQALEQTLLLTFAIEGYLNCNSGDSSRARLSDLICTQKYTTALVHISCDEAR